MSVWVRNTAFFKGKLFVQLPWNINNQLVVSARKCPFLQYYFIMPNLKNNRSKLRSQLQIISACIMVVVLSVSTNIFHMSIFSFIFDSSSTSLWFINREKKDMLSKCFLLFCIQQEHRFLFFRLCFFLKRAFMIRRSINGDISLCSYSKSGWSQKIPPRISSDRG